MPSPDVILAGLAGLANDWRPVAVAWHVAAVGLVAAWVAGVRPGARTTAAVLTAPMLSVSGLAWVAGNPFNALTFAGLAVALAAAAWRLPPDAVRLSPARIALPGAAIAAFGLTYPHFLETKTWLEYLYAAPVGVVPCPTIAAVIGVSLMTGLFRTPAWSVPLIAAGTAYGLIGLVRLGVVLDVGLIAGTLVLVLAVIAPGHRSAPVTTA